MRPIKLLILEEKNRAGLAKAAGMLREPFENEHTEQPGEPNTIRILRVLKGAPPLTTREVHDMIGGSLGSIRTAMEGLMKREYVKVVGVVAGPIRGIPTNQYALNENIGLPEPGKRGRES